MSDPRRILVFRKSSLGDVILTLPVLVALKKEFPDSRIDYLTRSQYAPVVRFHPAVDNVITFDKNPSFMGIIESIRQGKYDLFVDLQSNFQSLILRSALYKARRSSYPKRRLAREMVVRRSQLKFRVDHTVTAYFRALRKLGIESEPSYPIMTLPQESIDFADDFIESSFLNDHKRLVALCPGARYPEKRWPHYRGLAESLLEDPGNNLVVISIGRDEIQPDLGLHDPRLIPLKDLDILSVAAVLSKCEASITNDSGLMHLACAVQTPVVAIFGPTNPRLGFSPLYPGSRIICDDVFCSPCSVHGQKACRQPIKYCFENINVKRVTDALSELI